MAAITEEINEKMLAEAVSATPNYSIDYNSKPFQDVKADIANQEAELVNTYNGMINDTDKYYDKLIQNSQDWAAKQQQIQQDNTDFAIEKIEQQKDQAHKDYVKEQSGAYVDWQKQSNKYGVEAEKMASAGLANTGYAESSQVSMYNTYQNRVATARDSYNRAVLNYDNAIKDAILQNNAALAEIAYQALQTQLELSLEGFQYKNQLVLDLADKKTQLNNTKWNRYQDILNQMNTENALKEDIRQFDANMKWNTEQKELDRQHDLDMQEDSQTFQKEMAEVNFEYDKKLANIEKDLEYALTIAKTNEDIRKAKEQYKLDKQKLADETAAQKEILKYQYDLQRQAIGTVSGNTKSTTPSKTKQTTQKANINSFAEKYPITTKKSFTGSTRKEALSYLKANGVPTGLAVGIIDFADWSRRKNAGSTQAEIAKHKDYPSYLRSKVDYLVDVHGK